MEETMICVDCKTSKTPLWRRGPAGPKSLCNACGIRFRKKRSVVKSDKKKPLTSTSSTVSKNSVVVNTKKNMRIKLVLLQRQRSPTKKVKRQKIQNHQFGEVEQAAFLLMSLSCGSVFG